MKKVISAILAAAFVMAMFSSCTTDNTTNTNESSQSISEITVEKGEEETEDNAENKEIESSHTLFFKDSSKSSKAVATFFNSSSGASEDVEMKKIGEDSESFTFWCEGDTTLYNMAYVTYGDNKSFEFAFNKCVSGWYKTEDDFFPYTEGEEINFTPEFDDVTLIGFGYDKTIHIWKPDDYNASSDEQYSTIYVLDGQNIADFGRDYYQPSTSPGVIEQIKSAISVTGNKTIIVAIENYIARDFELTPDLTYSLESADPESPEPDDDRDFDNMNGSEFAAFAAKTLVPYVQDHYNVYTDALHTSITGNSLGGLESFYITLEYPDTFGTVGALSPSFLELDEKEWNDYFSKKSFNPDSPFIYLYTGPSGIDTDPEVTNMYNRLKDMGYPEDKLVLHFNENGSHAGIFWRSVFSEFLTAMYFQNVEPLQS